MLSNTGFQNVKQPTYVSLRKCDTYAACLPTTRVGVVDWRGLRPVSRHGFSWDMMLGICFLIIVSVAAMPNKLAQAIPVDDVGAVLRA